MTKVITICEIQYMFFICTLKIKLYKTWCVTWTSLIKASLCLGAITNRGISSTFTCPSLCLLSNSAGDRAIAPFPPRTQYYCNISSGIIKLTKSNVPYVAYIISSHSLLPVKYITLPYLTFVDAFAIGIPFAVTYTVCALRAAITIPASTVYS